MEVLQKINEKRKAETSEGRERKQTTYERARFGITDFFLCWVIRYLLNVYHPYLYGFIKNCTNF